MTILFIYYCCNYIVDFIYFAQAGDKIWFLQLYVY